MKIDWSGNTKAIGERWYLTTIRSRGRQGWWAWLLHPVQPAWTNEPEDPWRHGRGITLCLLPWWSLVIGRWEPTNEAHPWYRDDEVDQLGNPLQDKVRKRRGAEERSLKDVGAWERFRKLSSEHVAEEERV